MASEDARVLKSAVGGSSAAEIDCEGVEVIRRPFSREPAKFLGAPSFRPKPAVHDAKRVLFNGTLAGGGLQAVRADRFHLANMGTGRALRALGRLFRHRPKLLAEPYLNTSRLALRP